MKRPSVVLEIKSNGRGTWCTVIMTLTIIRTGEAGDKSPTENQHRCHQGSADGMLPAPGRDMSAAGVATVTIAVPEQDASAAAATVMTAVPEEEKIGPT